MSVSASDYEKLGRFYLGREYDGEAKKVEDELVLYDSKDLVTHGVVLGMTGSGKTGLCLALLEEAAMDNIPALVIDPKGDISNLLLTFPNLDAASFRPWINEDDAAKKGISPGRARRENRGGLARRSRRVGTGFRADRHAAGKGGYHDFHPRQPGGHPGFHPQLAGGAAVRDHGRR